MTQAKVKKTVEPIQAPRGTHDVLPPEQKYWEYVIETAKTVIRGFGWQQIDTPIFEEEHLFARGVGEETDIVSKEMFHLKQRGGGSRYVLRPEGTAPLARAYIEHGLRSWPKPVKLFYTGPFFRYERPQAGRWRQHHQIGLELWGSGAAISDVEVIYVYNLILRDLGIENYVLRINSLGVPAERQEYIRLLRDHYRRNRSKLCNICKERLKTNPLRVLDCKEEKCQQVANTAPRLLDHLQESSRRHFESVLTGLDALEIAYDVNPHLVRGLDYYTHTVCEFVSTGETPESATTLIAGGRYDGLIQELGGRETPGVGLAGGIERIIDQIKREGIELTLADKPRVFVAQLGEQAKYAALKVCRELQQAGIPFVESLDRDGMQAQLKMADRFGVQWTLIVGHKEVIDKTVILRSMESGMQEVIPRDKMVAELGRHLQISA